MQRLNAASQRADTEKSDPAEYGTEADLIRRIRTIEGEMAVLRTYPGRHLA